MIKRSKRAKNFTVVNNEIYADNGLSFEAMGLLTYLLSKPDNWQVNVKALAKVTHETDQKRGTNKIYDLLKVLESKGFIVRQKNANGSVDYTVYDEPVNCIGEQEKPVTRKPEQAKPNQENPEQAFSETYKELKDNKELNSKKNGIITPPLPPQGEVAVGENPPDEIPKTHEQAKAFVKKITKGKFTADDLVNLGVDEQIAKDWLFARKSPLTKTALIAVINQAQIAKLSVADAIQHAAENGWRGFRADWLKVNQSPNNTPISPNTNADGISKRHYSDWDMSNIPENPHVPF